MTDLSQLLWESLASDGVVEGQELTMDFTFEARNHARAERLLQRLAAAGVDAEAAPDGRQVLVTGQWVHPQVSAASITAMKTELQQLAKATGTTFDGCGVLLPPREGAGDGDRDGDDDDEVSPGVRALFDTNAQVWSQQRGKVAEGQPADTEFRSEFAVEDDARQMAVRLTGPVHEVEVQQFRSGLRRRRAWAVTGVWRHESLDLASLDAMTRELAELTWHYDGELAGWQVTGS